MTLSENNNPLPTQARAELDAFFASVGQGVNAYIEIMSRRRQIEALYAKSDAELADMGLTRDSIPGFAFSDTLDW